MDIRPILITLGIILLIGSFWWGDWAIWLGGPFLFLGIIFQFVDSD